MNATLSNVGVGLLQQALITAPDYLLWTTEVAGEDVEQEQADGACRGVTRCSLDLSDLHSDPRLQ
jgi:hypothetical protein